MRISTLALAIGLGFAAPVMLPTAAMAQSINAVLPAAEQTTVDAAIDAVMADTTLTPAQIQAQIAGIIQGSSNPEAATRRVIAKANQASTTALAEAMGGGIAQVVDTLQNSDPQTAAGLQTIVAVEGNVDVQIGYTTPQPFTPTTTTTPPTPVVTNTPTRRPTVPRRPVPPTEPVVPVVPEPNPVQAVNPIIIVNPVNGSGGSPT